ncbi:MAG: GDSL-type esterase/lipase family protein [Terrimicrobiaceae bacterium]
MQNEFPQGWRKVVSPVPDPNPRGLKPGSEEMITPDSTQAKTGKYSVRIASPTDPVRCSISINQAFQAGQTWRFSAWVKGVGVVAASKQGVAIRIALNNTKDSELNKVVYKSSALAISKLAGDFDWTQISCEATVPENTTRMAVELGLWETSGTIWFDDAELVLVSGTPSAAPKSSPDANGLDIYAAANQALLAKGPVPDRVVFLGDSIIYKWNLPSFFPNEPFVNRGIGGQATEQMQKRLDQDVLALMPKTVVFLGGTNDLSKTRTPERIVSSIAGIIDQLNAAGIRVIVSSVLPVSDYHKDVSPKNDRTVGRPPVQILEINRRLKLLCAEKHAVYLDFYSALADSSDMMPADFAEDGLHPNDKGYAKMAPLVLRAIQEANKP